ncbi:acetyl-CoA carboxylase biotin carboxyl carrier protein [Clostridium beijerinckii]|nr:biotin/lipoyl-containing protein [Clostridium beijerinckii]
MIEVMKLFNEVEAGVQGTIVDILVKDGEFVEYGQPLFEIKSK